jgi:hypothetical protein
LFGLIGVSLGAVVAKQSFGPGGLATVAVGGPSASSYSSLTLAATSAGRAAATQPAGEGPQ